MINTERFPKLNEEEIAKYTFPHCARCRFYPCESTNEYSIFRDLFSSDPCEIKNYCSLFAVNFNPVECGNKTVADGIGDHYKISTTRYGHGVEKSNGKWEPSQPVFISAQMGAGKNYFIENKLLPYVKELNQRNTTKQRVLIISNRLALKKQIEDRLDGEDEDRVYPYADFADIITYQGFLNRADHFNNVQKNKDKISSYIYVICDEAHFFTSDAMFNPDTKKILSAIVNTFGNAIRVYMSATPYECFRYIHECEDTLQDNNPFVFYHFKRDFSYLTARYYSAFDELQEVVVKSVLERKEKWIVFIDDKERCKKFMNKLEDYADKISKQMSGKILAVDANSKTEESYQRMIRNESLDKDVCVLITTSVLDNGVNLRGIKNIVVSNISKVKTLQIVGRARKDGGEDTKVLYLKRFDERYMQKVTERLEKQKDAYHSLDLAYNSSDKRERFEFDFLMKYYNSSFDDWENAKHWFGRRKGEPSKLYGNGIAISMVDMLLPTYKSVAAEMEVEAANQTSGLTSLFGQKYLEYQLSWFGMTYSSENNLKDPEEDKIKFIEFLERYANSGECISGNDEKIKFREKFTRLHNQVFPPPKSIESNKDRDLLGFKLMNNELEKHKIKYQIVKDKDSVWRVEKLTETET